MRSSLYLSALCQGIPKRSSAPPSRPMKRSAPFRRKFSGSPARNIGGAPSPLRTIFPPSAGHRCSGETIRSDDHIMHNRNFPVRAGLGLMIFSTWTFRPPPIAKSGTPTSKCKNRTPGISPRIAMADFPIIRDSERAKSIRESLQSGNVRQIPVGRGGGWRMVGRP